MVTDVGLCESEQNLSRWMKDTFQEASRVAEAVESGIF